MYDFGFWHDELVPYSGATWATNLFAGKADTKSRLYLCPSYARACPVPAADLWPDTADGWKAMGAYGYNASGLGSTGFLTNGLGPDTLGLGGTGPRATRETEVAKPSLMIAIGDASLIGWAPFGATTYCVVGENLLSFDFPFVGAAPGYVDMIGGANRRRHGGRRNMVFCDGHVSSFAPREVFDYSSDRILSMWNKDNRPHRELVPPWVP